MSIGGYWLLDFGSDTVQKPHFIACGYFDNYPSLGSESTLRSGRGSFESNAVVLLVDLPWRPPGVVTGKVAPDSSVDDRRRFEVLRN